MYDTDIISVFWSSTNWRTLVHELGRNQPKTMKELFDIATRHPSGEEVVGAIFIQGSGKAVLDGGRGAPPKATDKEAKSNKRGPKRQPQRITVITRCDKGDNGKEVGDSDEELITIAEHNCKHQARQLADHLEKLIEVTCPNHTYHVGHKLKECIMMKNYMTTGNIARTRSSRVTRRGRLLLHSSKKRRWKDQGGDQRGGGERELNKILFKI
jgi:hypothetical protein